MKRLHKLRITFGTNHFLRLLSTDFKQILEKILGKISFLSLFSMCSDTENIKFWYIIFAQCLPIFYISDSKRKQSLLVQARVYVILTKSYEL